MMVELIDSTPILKGQEFVMVKTKCIYCHSTCKNNIFCPSGSED